MTPQVMFWLVWTLATAGRPMVRTDFGPYDGPLADRLIARQLPEFPSNFTIDVDSDDLRGFEYWLKSHPIYVRAPGSQYIAWGLRTFRDEPGAIFVLRFNVLLLPHEQPLGPYQGDAGAMLAWAFSVLDHYGLPYDPRQQEWEHGRDKLISLYRETSDPVDWQAVAKLLRATGRAVPADLFEQPTR